MIYIHVQANTDKSWKKINYIQIDIFRNRIISSEMQALKGHMKVLLDKGAHDDELIEALMVSTDQCLSVCLL